MHYLAILLVLASDDESLANTNWSAPRIYPEWKPMFPYFKRVWEAYHQRHERIKVLYVYGDSNIDEQPYHLIYPHVRENNYPGMITKTLLAMQDIDKTYDYDFLIRTNLSTFWNLDRLATRLETLPTQKCLVGTVVEKHEVLKMCNHFTVSPFLPEKYVAGYDMIISRDLIQGIIPFSQKIINHRVVLDMEDLALNLAFQKYCRVTVTDLDRAHQAMDMYMFNQFNEEKFLEKINKSVAFNQDHFRVKNRLDRRVDKIILKKLLSMIYHE